MSSLISISDSITTARLIFASSHFFNNLSMHLWVNSPYSSSASSLYVLIKSSRISLSKSFPPSCKSYSYASTEYTTPFILCIVALKEVLLRSYTNTTFPFGESLFSKSSTSQYAYAAATGSGITRIGFKPTSTAVSRISCRCKDENHTGTDMTTSEISNPQKTRANFMRCSRMQEDTCSG